MNKKVLLIGSIVLIIVIAIIALIAPKEVKGVANPDPNEEAYGVTLEQIVEVYRQEGLEIDMEEKPHYRGIGAIDAVIFYHDRSPVKIYEFSSQKALADAPYSYIRTYGRFTLETRKEEAVAIFDGLME